MNTALIVLNKMTNTSAGYTKKHINLIWLVISNAKLQNNSILNLMQ